MQDKIFFDKINKNIEQSQLRSVMMHILTNREIRSTKFEILNKFKYQMTKFKTTFYKFEYVTKKLSPKDLKTLYFGF